MVKGGRIGLRGFVEGDGGMILLGIWVMYLVDCEGVRCAVMARAYVGYRGGYFTGYCVELSSIEATGVHTISIIQYHAICREWESLTTHVS